MPSKQQKAKKPAGFTIIEVVLVLAIAGLIFLMVFVALPALQRSQRDTQRRSDAARVNTAMQNWLANNKNEVPNAGSTCASSDSLSSGSDACKLVKDYLNPNSATTNEFRDPENKAYSVVMTTNADTANGSNDINAIYVVLKGKCDGSKAAMTTSKSKYAIVLKLDSSGYYCTDNH